MADAVRYCLWLLTFNSNSASESISEIPVIMRDSVCKMGSSEKYELGIVKGTCFQFLSSVQQTLTDTYTCDSKSWTRDSEQGKHFTSYRLGTNPLCIQTIWILWCHLEDI